MYHRIPIAVGCALLVGCRVSQFDTAQPPAEGSAAVAAAPDPVAVPASEGSVDLTGSARPSIDVAAQRCEVDSECRVIQPGDWSADVECCYEYGCGLDYVAVNQATLQQQRAWQSANAFDCTEHLRINGPCETRVPRCGLDQTPPPAVCRSGVCAIAWPEPWPRVDADAQTCSIDADCRVFRPSSNAFAARCCNADCGQDWVAVNSGTLGELTRWRGENAPSCEQQREAGGTCPEATDCAPAAPSVSCVAGMCQVATP